MFCFLLFFVNERKGILPKEGPFGGDDDSDDDCDALTRHVRVEWEGESNDSKRGKVLEFGAANAPRQLELSSLFRFLSLLLPHPFVSKYPLAF